MNFASFTDFLSRLDGTSSRLEITQILAELLTEVSPEEAKVASYLLIGSLGPSYERGIFNVADKMMERALATAFDTPLERVIHARRESGDLGTAAFSLAPKSREVQSALTEIYESLLRITEAGGEGSQEKRIQDIAHVLQKLSPLSAKYVVRIILGNLRLGFSEKTIIDALSWMETGGKSKSGALAKAYQVIPDIGLLAQKVKENGIDATAKKVAPIVGIPIEPMLCQRLKSPRDMIAKMGSVAVEPKFDGLRVVIHFHKKKGILKAYTRNLKEISTMFPELKEIGKHVHAESIILDTEAVGMDQELMKIADFQTTMQRRRKHEIESLQSKIPVTFQVFDIMFLDGESLMDVPYQKRRETLTKVLKDDGLLKTDQFVATDDPEKITALHEQYRNQGLEGIIVKKLDSTYVPGRLGWRWVKMKEAEEATGKLPDTVDAIIMGYTRGKGKRAQFGIGQFLAGVKDGDRIKTLTKVGTGLTDVQFHELERRLQEFVLKEKPKEYEVHKDLTPDYWVDPQVIVELAGDDLTVSPKHTAGYALRFPRLVKFRDDRSPAQATTVKEIQKLFTLQKN